MGEQHLDALSIAARLLECFGLCHCAGNIAGRLVEAARDSAHRRPRTASILSGLQTRALPWCEKGTVVERRPPLLPSAQRVPVPQRALRPSRTPPCGNPPTPPAF